LVLSIKSGFSSFLKRLLRKNKMRIGIYGPPNAGKTTLANRILMDWVGDIIGPVSEIPHETRKAILREGIRIESNGKSLLIDIVDTPGLATKIDFREFMKYGLNEDEAKRRAKEATEGVIEAIRWLDNLDGVIVVMDSTEDPFTQVNITVIGNIEARKLPLIIVANKIDLPTAAPTKIKTAFPQHTVIPISALKGINMEDLYKTMIKKFG